MGQLKEWLLQGKIDLNETFGKNTLSKILSWIGAKDVSELSYIKSGAMGSAYRLGNNVAKFTTDESEARAAAIVCPLNLPGIYEVFKVGKIKPNPEEDDIVANNLYIIICKYYPNKLSKDEGDVADKLTQIQGQTSQVLFRNWHYVGLQNIKHELQKLSDVATICYELFRKSAPPDDILKTIYEKFDELKIVDNLQLRQALFMLWFFINPDSTYLSLFKGWTFHNLIAADDNPKMFLADILSDISKFNINDPDVQFGYNILTTVARLWDAGIEFYDFHSENILKDENGNLIIIDLGASKSNAETKIELIENKINLKEWIGNDIELSKDIPENLLNKILAWAGINSVQDLHKLGSGAMGTAYRFGNKVLKLTTDQSEAVAAAQVVNLNHPNIYKVFKVGKTNNFKGGEQLWLIICEFVPGGGPSDAPRNIINDIRSYVQNNDGCKSAVQKWNSYNANQIKQTLLYINECIDEILKVEEEKREDNFDIYEHLPDLYLEENMKTFLLLYAFALSQTNWPAQNCIETILGSGRGVENHRLEALKKLITKFDFNDKNIQFVDKVCAAVSFLYQNGIEFEDFHGGNIRMRGEEPVLIDLGVSKTTGGSGQIDILENKKDIQVEHTWKQFLNEGNVAKSLYHTTNWFSLDGILKTNILKPKNPESFVSLSARPMWGDISGNDAVIAIDIPANVMPVTYKEWWANKYPEQASYIAGEGWQQQYVEPDECMDDDGFVDDNCAEDAYKEAELDAFVAKSDEDEWISINPGELIKIQIKHIYVFDKENIDIVKAATNIPISVLGQDINNAK